MIVVPPGLTDTLVEKNTEDMIASFTDVGTQADSPAFWEACTGGEKYAQGLRLTIKHDAVSFALKNLKFGTN